ncbi:hypothetical protein ABT009_37375 [Streptomyces sp. NPDC002896]|uniref:hypothetical protein n=1 Tax=Streptomyces sp. NPDC002896 TaxID=3154438 RepID=UPI00332A63C9
MRTQSIGMGAIGVGTAGCAHLGGYRVAPTVHDNGLPKIRLVAVDDAQKALAGDTARRNGSRHADFGSKHADSGRGIAFRTMFLKALHDLSTPTRL